MDEALAIPNPLETTRAWLGKLDVKRRLMRLPLPAQILLTFTFSQILALTIAIPDLLPLVDEAIAGWLFYVGLTATSATIRTRFGPRLAAWRQRHRLAAAPADPALPDLERGEELGLDPVLVHASLQEVGALE
ncbi:MAG: hypothetical protein ABIO70_31430 [Pseudomonadota bacterium]